MICGFAFPRNASTRVMYALNRFDYCYVLWPNNLDQLVKRLLRDQPEHILGMGIWSGRDQDKVRIETRCTNIFRRGFIEGNSLRKLKLKPFLKPDQGSKYGTGMGFSYCNRASWRVAREIEKGQLNSEFCFLHLPRMMKDEQLVAEVINLLESSHV
jgi:pyrrolidone-carboxylate peptidase